MYRRLGIDIADKLGQVGVPEHLADRQVLAGVIPVVVDHALQQRAEDVFARPAVSDDMLVQLLDRDQVEPGIGGRVIAFQAAWTSSSAGVLAGAP